jgi:hypothetical protein
MSGEDRGKIEGESGGNDADMDMLITVTPV